MCYLLTCCVYSTVASIIMDEKTPTAETVSPIPENSKLVKQSCTIPAPSQSDFVDNDSDIYSQQCTETLDNLENLKEEEGEDEFGNICSSLPVNKPMTTKKAVNLKLLPLELTEHIETPKTQQKLTTPGKKLGL